MACSRSVVVVVVGLLMWHSSSWRGFLAGGKLVYQYTNKRASGPKCPVTGKKIQGVSFWNTLLSFIVDDVLA